jgi:hypothetical protein
MKLRNIIWVLALAGAVIGCNSGPPITNAGGSGGGSGSGGTAGSGGTGGIGGEGACTDEANQAVYDDLVYINADGDEFTGADAASEMGSDCIFGSASSVPSLAGCGGPAGAVIACFPNCEDSVIQEAADCVAMCVQDGTAEASPPGLSDECVACTGDTVACGAAFCTNFCVSDTNSPECIGCRCDNNCIQDFDSCSGLPGGGECG